MATRRYLRFCHINTDTTHRTAAIATELVAVPRARDAARLTRIGGAAFSRSVHCRETRTAIRGNHMAALFAVFLAAILTVVLRPEGRSERMAQLCLLRADGVGAGRAILERGTEVLDVIAAWLAADRRGRPTL